MVYYYLEIISTLLKNGASIFTPNIEGVEPEDFCYFRSSEIELKEVIASYKRDNNTKKYILYKTCQKIESYLGTFKENFSELNVKNFTNHYLQRRRKTVYAHS